MSKPEWTFRPAGPDDIMEVIKWWIGSFRKSKWAGCIPNNKFPEVQGEIIKQLITRGSKCLLAVNPDSPSQKLGFVVTEKTSLGEPVVHFLFVKDIYRQKGVAKSLLAEAKVPVDGSAFYTHKTAYSKHFNGKFVPEIARRKAA